MSKHIKKKTVTEIRIFLFLKIIPSIILFLFYMQWVKGSFEPIYTYLMSILIATVVVFYLAYKKKDHPLESFAQASLYKTDSFSISFSYILLFLMLIVNTLITPSAIINGYMISGSIVFLCVLRAVSYLAFSNTKYKKTKLSVYNKNSSI